MRNYIYLIVLMISSSLSTDVIASRLVSVEITGCVTGGSFYSEVTDFGTHRVAVGRNRYRIKLRYAGKPSGALGQSKRVPLHQFEGKRLKIKGQLLPGDLFFTSPSQIQVSGNCLQKQGSSQEEGGKKTACAERLDMVAKGARFFSKKEWSKSKNILQQALMGAQAECLDKTERNVLSRAADLLEKARAAEARGIGCDRRMDFVKTASNHCKRKEWKECQTALVKALREAGRDCSRQKKLILNRAQVLLNAVTAKLDEQKPSALARAIPATVPETKAQPTAKPVKQVVKVLFNGTLSKQWKEISSAGGDFKKFTRYRDNVLVVEVPDGHSWGKTGIISAKSLVNTRPLKTDLLVRLSFDIDFKNSSSYVLGLIPDDKTGKDEWSAHDFRLHVVKTKKDEPAKLTLFIKQKAIMKGSLSPQASNSIHINLHPDGVVLVTDGENNYLAEGVMPDELPDKGYHIYAQAHGPQANIGSKMALRSISLENLAYKKQDDPVGFPRGTEPMVLFNGRFFGKHLTSYNAHGGDFSKHGKFENGALVVDVPEKNGSGKVGIMSPGPIVSLGSLGEGAQTSVRFEFDPERTTGFITVLAPIGGRNGANPAKPSIMLHWHLSDNGDATVVIYLNDKKIREYKELFGAPKRMRFNLRSGGVWVDAPGLPEEIIPWPVVVSGAGFRLYAYSHPGKKDAPVKMALKQIRLEQKAGAPVTKPKPAEGVAPLPQTVLFNGAPNDKWEGAGVSGGNFKKHARFESCRLLVEIPDPSGSSWSKAGLLSTKPLVNLDERIHSTSFKLAFKFDPARTNGLQIMMSGRKEAAMWRNSSAKISYIRNGKGRHAGKYTLGLSGSGWSGHNSWSRLVDAEWMKKNWDGRLEIEIGNKWIAAHIPGGPSVRGPGFSVGKGSKLYVTVYAHPENSIGGSKIALEKITSEWVMPDGMSQSDRFLYLDNEAFDANAFINQLTRYLVETEQSNPGQYLKDMFEVPKLAPPTIPKQFLKKSSSQNGCRFWAWFNPVSSAQAAPDCSKEIDDHLAKMRRIQITLGEQPDLLKSFFKLGNTIIGSSDFGKNVSGDPNTLRKFHKQMNDLYGHIGDGIAIGEDWKAGEKGELVIHIMQAALNIGLGSGALGSKRTHPFQNVNKEVRGTWAKAMKGLPKERARQIISRAKRRFNPNARISTDKILKDILDNGPKFDIGNVLGQGMASTGDTKADVSAALWTLTDNSLKAFSPHYKVAEALANTMVDTAKTAKAFVVNDRVSHMYEVWKKEMMNSKGLGAKDFYNARTVVGDRVPLTEIKNLMRKSPDQEISDVAAESMLFKHFRKWFQAEQAANKKSDRLSFINSEFNNIKCRHALEKHTWPKSRSSMSRAWNDFSNSATWGEGTSESWSNYWNSCMPEIEMLKKYSEIESNIRNIYTKWMKPGNKCNTKNSIDGAVRYLACVFLEDGDLAFRKNMMVWLKSCGLIKEITKKEKQQRRTHIMTRLTKLNHKKLQKVLKGLNINPPADLFSCICRNMGYGTSNTQHYYHPGPIKNTGPLGSSPACASAGKPCINSGWGCTRHPLSSDPKIWERCIGLYKLNVTKTADGKVDPKSGERLDNIIEEALRKSRGR